MGEFNEIKYDIALSFAGENRAVVEDLAEVLVALGIRVFYDNYELADLWGKDLYQHLQTVYCDRARYCIIFVSEAYGKKLWTRHELKQAQARAFKEREEYILPVRLDDTEIPGLNATTGYVDLRHHSLAELSQIIVQKLFGTETHLDDVGELTWRGELVKFRGQEVASFWPKKLEHAQSITHYIARVPRIKYGNEDNGWDPGDMPCSDCGAMKGEFHVPSCDVERCPVCSEQALGCNCIEGDAGAEEDFWDES